MGLFYMHMHPTATVYAHGTSLSHMRICMDYQTVPCIYEHGRQHAAAATATTTTTTAEAVRTVAYYKPACKEI